MERQAGLGRSLEDVLDSVPPVEPLEPARTNVLFGIASEEPPVVDGASHPEPLAPSGSAKKKKKKKKSDGDKKKNKQSGGKGDKKKKKK